MKKKYLLVASCIMIFMMGFTVDAGHVVGLEGTVDEVEEILLENNVDYVVDAEDKNTLIAEITLKELELFSASSPEADEYCDAVTKLQLAVDNGFSEEVLTQLTAEVEICGLSLMSVYGVEDVDTKFTITLVCLEGTSNINQYICAVLVVLALVVIWVAPWKKKQRRER